MSTQTLTKTPTDISEITPPRDGTKQAKLVSMLSRKSGVTLAKASEALGWLPHTTSATMTGLRKRGYAITRTERPNKDSVYFIGADEIDA
jgi:hypothetical protein